MRRCGLVLLWFAFAPVQAAEPTPLAHLLDGLVVDYVRPELTAWRTDADRWLADPCDARQTAMWTARWKRMSPLWSLPPMRSHHARERLGRYALSPKQQQTLAGWSDPGAPPTLPLLALIEDASTDCDRAGALAPRVAAVAEPAAFRMLLDAVATEWTSPDGSGAFFDELDVLHAVSQRLVEPLRALLDPERELDEPADVVLSRANTVFFAGAPDQGFYAVRASQNTLAARSLQVLRQAGELPPDTLLEAFDAVLATWQIGAGFNASDGD